MNRIFFLFLFLIGQSLIAQTDVWTLERCFAYAKENNIQLQQSRLNTEFAQIDLDQSRSNRLPSLNGVAAQRFNFGRSIDPTSNEFITQNIPSTYLGLDGNVPVFQGFQLKNTIERNEMSLNDAQIQNRVQENNLGLSIVSAYLEILRAQDQIKVLEEQATITQEQKSRTEKLIKAGVLAQGDILNIDAQIAQERLNLVNAENALEFARLNLMQILDYYDSAIEVVRPEMDVPSPDELNKMDVNQIYQKALSNLPEVRSAQLQKDIAEKDVDIAKGSKLPSVSLSAGASTNYAGVRFGSEIIGLDTTVVGFVPGTPFDLPDIPVLRVIPEFGGKKTGVPFFDQIEQNFSYNVGINASIPIFNRHQINNGIKRAELAVKNAQLTSSITKNSLLQAIQQAYQAARSAAQAYETNRTNIQSLEQALANVEKRYELGLATALEYSTARNNLAVAQLNLNSAKYEYMFRLKILEYYEGKPLKF